MTRLTIATPTAHLDDTRNLAVALGWINGYTPQEWEQSFSARYQDAQGNIFHVSSFEASTGWIATATTMGPVERPPQDVGTLDEDTGEYGAPYVVNLTAARRAQDRLVIWQPAQPDPETGEMPSNPVPQASATNLVAVIGMKGPAAVAAIGLQAIPMEI
jgi:hypothetical protein